MNIEELKSGKELDKLVAEHIFGGAHLCSFLCQICGSRHFGSVRDKRMCHGWRCFIEWSPEEALPNYSTDIVDVWLVVEYLQTLPPVYRGDSYDWFSIAAHNRTGNGSGWSAGWRYRIDYEDDYWYAEQYGNTVMEAICKAALYRVLQDLEVDAGLTEMSHV